MAGRSERTYYGQDPIEWLIRDIHKEKVTSRVKFLQWQYGEDTVANAGLTVEWQDKKVGRLHHRVKERDIVTSFLPREQFMSVSQTIEDTVVSLDFNKPDEEGNVSQESSVILLHVSSPEYNGATQCVLTSEEVDWEKERVGHIISSIGTDREKNLFVATRLGAVYFPLARNIYNELERIENKLG